ncbi:hypothetical protein L1987_10051 [Smallanthus sonchifolius]|uniref:Uncharacterized protein n=1 Tax=Smallanthus sonchifolius TaxID=185202 RepID=A0ACB9JR02_9ASTR|nr:hypothetical protein L1987_10051 [Smallanthus sonchifolius]
MSESESKESAATAAATSRARKSKSLSLSGMLKILIIVFVAKFSSSAYNATLPPPPKLCGSPDGPPITTPRVKLQDGRHVSYVELGVPKDVAKSKLIYVHCFDCSKYLNPFAAVSPDVIEELGVYIVSLDRPGYGESDPDPKRTVKSIALDIEEFANQLNLGPKFYVAGFSMGGQVIWSCLKYIPHRSVSKLDSLIVLNRLAGAVLISPAVNYWWRNLPSNLTNQAYSQLLPQDQWTYRVAHHLPWLTHWWNSQKMFHSFSVISGHPDILSFSDLIVVSKLLAPMDPNQWDFDPMDLENPFPNNDGSVHLWMGDEDNIVPLTIQRYIAQQLGWLDYHEIFSIVLHCFPAATMKETVNKKVSADKSDSGVLKILLLAFFIGFSAWAYQTALPTSPKELGSPDGLPITTPRIKLRDGRHLSYIEYGVPKDVAKRKLIYLHCFSCSKYHNPFVVTASPAVVEELGVYIVAIDRPGYGESDPDPKRTVKSLALDIEEFADHLDLGPKFYVAGFSLGGQVIWSCLKYIPHRLAGAILISPTINYWWHNLPSNLTNEAYSRRLQQDQWSLRVAHYLPWLTYWWNTQTWISGFTTLAGSPAILSSADIEITSKLFTTMDPTMEKLMTSYPTQQGEYESIHRDVNIGFGKWEFDPIDLENPFPNNDGSVHLWMGDDDFIVPVTLQSYIARQLGWIKYHEITGEGHLFAFKDGMGETILKELFYNKN